MYESIAAPKSNFHSLKALGSSRGRGAHEDGITESNALRNLRQTFNLSNTTQAGAHSAARCSQGPPEVVSYNWLCIYI